MEERLPYEHARTLIQSGDLIFVCKKGIFHQKLISWFTQSEHVHVGIAFWTLIEGSYHLMIAEANGGAQRRIVNLSHYKDYNLDVIIAPRPWDEIKHKALDRLGQVQYNWIQAGYVGVNEVFERTFGFTLPDIDMPGEICTEYVSNTYELPLNHLSPAALFKYLHTGLKHNLRVKTKGS